MKRTTFLIAAVLFLCSWNNPLTYTDIPDNSYLFTTDDIRHGKWTSVNHTLDMKFTLDLFTGYRSALFCYSTAEAGGYADFGWFRQRVTAPQ